MLYLLNAVWKLPELFHICIALRTIMLVGAFAVTTYNPVLVAQVVGGIGWVWPVG
jgi:hypothetical protein